MCKFLYSTEEFALLRVIAAILFSKEIRCTGQAQMYWISGDGLSLLLLNSALTGFSLGSPVFP